MQVHLLRKKSWRRFFFHYSRYFSVFLNIEPVSVSVFSNIAISVSISIIRPTSMINTAMERYSPVIKQSHELQPIFSSPIPTFSFKPFMCMGTPRNECLKFCQGKARWNAIYLSEIGTPKVRDREYSGEWVEVLCAISTTVLIFCEMKALKSFKESTCAII